MLGWLEAAAAVAGVLTVAAGLLLAFRGVHTAATRFMAAWFVFYGIEQVAVVTVGGDSLAWNVASGLLLWSILSFAVAYPGPGLRPMRRWVIVWLFIVCVGLSVAVEYDPFFRVATPGQVLSHALSIIGFTGVPLLLAWRALTTRSPLQRDQLIWLVVPFLFWLIHDSVYVLRPESYVLLAQWGVLDTPGARVGLAWSTLNLLLAAAAGVTAAVGAWKLAGVPRKQARAVLVAFLLTLLISPLQFMVGIEREATMHVLADSAFGLLLFYGIARYGIVDLKLRLRWSVKHGTIASVFLAVFFVVSESAAALLGDTTGSTYVGIASAGLLVFAIAPLQRLAERLSRRAVPVAEGQDAYVAYRRLRIYRAALEGALKDGRVDPWEADALQGLRRELGVTDEEHALLEAEVRGTSAPPETAAAPVGASP